jgi:hypothetical protein
MGLVNIQNHIDKKICDTLKGIQDAEKCGEFDEFTDDRIKNLSIIKSFWKQWSDDQIEKLETFLFSRI